MREAMLPREFVEELVSGPRAAGFQAAVARLEAGKAFNAVTDAKAEVSRIFQVSTERSLAEDSDGAKEISRSN